LFSPAPRRRARPSLKSLALSSVVFVGALWLAFANFFFYYVYIPAFVALVISLAVFSYRTIRLRAAMPEPYGKGQTSVVGAKAAIRLGMIIAFGGGALLIALMASVFFLPPVAFFALLFGVTAGMPLSQILFFGIVSWYERKSSMKIYFVNEETQANDEEVVVRSVDMA